MQPQVSESRLPVRPHVQWALTVKEHIPSIALMLQARLEKISSAKACFFAMNPHC